MARRERTAEPVTHHEERPKREQRGTGTMRLDGLWLMAKGLAGIAVVVIGCAALYWAVVHVVAARR